jgi:CRISPR-associated protein Csm5
MKGNPEYQSKTKTLWLAANDPKQRTNLLPFGWLLVEIHPNDTQISELDELAALCKQHNKPMTAWGEKQISQKNEFAEKRKEAEQSRQQENIDREKAKQKDEQDQKDKLATLAAEQQRLANLSPLDQELEAFLKPIQASEHDTRLLKELESGRWQNEDAQLVAERVKELMENAGKWMPDFNGTNGQRLRLRERSQTVIKYLQG